ncbi:MAG: ABC transporter permease [Rhodospirillaceae bacterium]|nr:ABC transporter permease [Rhodospirillaceae bacterium]
MSMGVAAGAGADTRSLGGIRSLVPAMPALIFLFVVFVVPLGILFLRSVTDPEPGFGNYERLVSDSTYITVLFNTMLVSIVVTATALLLSYPVAWFLVICPPGAMRWIFAIILLSMWTNLLARTYAWLVLLQNTGAINHFLMWLGIIDQPLELVNNMIGVIIGMTYIMLPFMILPLHATISAIDPALMQAASIAGASPGRVFRRVMLPLSLPGISAGCIMVFVMSLGYYITPALLGGAKDMMIAVLIAQQIQQLLNWGLGSAAAFVLLLITLVIYFIYIRFVGFKRPI